MPKKQLSFPPCSLQPFITTILFFISINLKNYEFLKNVSIKKNLLIAYQVLGIVLDARTKTDKG